MGIGTGLGAFVSGAVQGYQAGSDIRDDMTKRKNQKALLGIEQQGKQDFDAIKATDPNADFNRFYTNTVIPRKIEALRLQGDDEGAARFEKWANDRGAQEGAKLFGSAIIKGQGGDIDGAVQDFVGAAKAKGYVAHGFEIVSTEPTKDFDGKTTGYTLTMKDAEGQTHVQKFNSPQEVMQFGSSMLNPEVAYQSWQQQASTAAANKTDLAKEEYKLKIKRDDDVERKRLGLAGKEEPGKVYDGAVKALSESDPNWVTYTPEQQKTKVDDYLKQRSAYIDQTNGGGADHVEPPSGPKQRVIVDNVTGQPVDDQPDVEATSTPAAAPASTPSPGLGLATRAAPAAQPAPAAAPSRKSAAAVGIGVPLPRSRPASAQPPVPQSKPAAAAAQTTPAAAPPQAEPMATMADPGLEQLRQGLAEQQQRVLDAAQKAYRSGIDPAILRPGLQQAGIPGELWPF